jgi:hypothetical protein
VQLAAALFGGVRRLICQPSGDGSGHGEGPIFRNRYGYPRIFSVSPAAFFAAYCRSHSAAVFGDAAAPGTLNVDAKAMAQTEATIEARRGDA